MGHSQLWWRFARVCAGQSRNRSPVLEKRRRAGRIVLSYRQLRRICVRPRTRSERLRSATRRSSTLDRSGLCRFRSGRGQQLRRPSAHCAHHHRWQYCDLKLTLDCGCNSAKPRHTKQLRNPAMYMSCTDANHTNRSASSETPDMIALIALAMDTPSLTQTVAPPANNSRILSRSHNNCFSNSRERLASWWNHHNRVCSHSCRVYRFRVYRHIT